MKNQSTSVVRIAVFLALVFALVLGIKPVSVKAAVSEHHLYPYQSTNMYIYNGDPEKTFSMMGQSYKYGLLKRDTTADAYAEFNLDGKIDTVSFQVGHMDGANSTAGTLKIYLDDEYQSQSWAGTDNGHQSSSNFYVFGY